MPNWCFNYATISNSDKSKMDKLRKAIKAGKVLQSFFPTPKKLLEGEGWYMWRVGNWGTKWDLCDIETLHDDGETISLQFNTAWSPPTEAYQKLIEQGFWIDAYYSEAGMGFCGYFSQGVDDCYSLDSFTKEWIEANIPDSIIDACDLLAYCDQDDDMMETEGNNLSATA